MSAPAGWLGFVGVLRAHGRVAARRVRAPGVHRALVEAVDGTRFGDAQAFALDDVGYVGGAFDFLRALAGDLYAAPIQFAEGEQDATSGAFDPDDYVPSACNVCLLPETCEICGLSLRDR